MKTHPKLIFSLFATLFFVVFPQYVKAQTYDMVQYFLSPGDLVVNTGNIGFDGSTGPGTDCFYRGTMWGRTVAFHGDTSMKRYDIFVDEVVGGTEVINYYDTFLGNSFSSGNSTSFQTPFTWMNRYMSVGQVNESSVYAKALDNKNRYFYSGNTNTLRIVINSHLNSYTIPENGITFNDVIQFTYYPDTSVANTTETYWIAKGYSIIRFVATNSGGNPSSVNISYATSIARGSPPPGAIAPNSTCPLVAGIPISTPTLPWFDPFTTPQNYSGTHNTAYVPNGYFNNQVNPAEGGQVSNHLKSWTGSSSDCVLTSQASPPGDATWAICLKGSAGGGNNLPDAAITDNIPVTPGATYQITANVYRQQPSDSVYIDMNDGVGTGQNFPDANAVSATYGTWEKVTASTTVGTSTTGIKIRCVRDGANAGNAYFSHVLLQRVN